MTMVTPRSPKLFDRDPTDVELRELRGEFDSPHVVETNETLIGNPVLVPVWFLALSLSLPALVLFWFAWNGDRTAGGMLALIGVGIIPLMLGGAYLLNRYHRQVGPYFRVDKRNGNLELCQFGRSIAAADILAITVTHYEGIEGWMRQNGVLVRAPQQRVEFLPIVSEQFDVMFCQKLADRLGELLGVPVRRVKFGRAENGCMEKERRRIRPLSAVVVAALLAAPAAGEEIGSITGVIAPPPAKASVAVIHRATGARTAGHLDPTTGKFLVSALPVDRKFDLVIDYDGGARLEGIDLSVPRSDYEEEQPLAPEDVETIRKKALAMNKFEDVVDILAIQGNIQHAAVLMNKVRTRPFYGSAPGQIVWRAELWHFERPEETWAKVQDEQFLVLYRQRIQKTAYEQMAITFSPELGGLTAAKSPGLDVGQVQLPPAKPGVRMAPAKPAAEAETPAEAPSP